MEVTVSATNQCAGLTHIRLTAVVTSGPTINEWVDAEKLRQALTTEERSLLLEYLVRAHITGMNGANARAALLAGWVVTL